MILLMSSISLKEKTSLLKFIASLTRKKIKFPTTKVSGKNIVNYRIRQEVIVPISRMIFLQFYLI